MDGTDARTGILCLGASTGGLRSLEAVLSRLPSSFPWPILVSQHLQRDHVSRMAEILSRTTRLAVREAAEGEIPQPGVVYTCPSSAELGLSPEGRLTLRAPVAGHPQRIDHLFATASFARPGLVIAVVLSGTGSDGAAGSLVVKLNGGTVIAESAESAQQSAMPRAAVKAGAVDATCPADGIAPLIQRLAEGGLAEATEAMRRDVGEIAETLAATSGTDFTRYRHATLRRRIEKRRALAGVATVRAYHDLLKRDAQERAALVKSLLLPVTEFFRDPPAWEALADKALPALVERARSGGTVRVWCAGCASGEEAYTMAMVLAELGAPAEGVRILGTDLDPDSIQLASAGVYDAARMENVDAERRARFFHADAGAFRVDAALRRMVDFRVHDLTRDAPPEGPFDVILCRNVLIYFDDTLQDQVLAAFSSRIAPGGVLFLGRSTTLPRHADEFEPLVSTMRIFRNRRVPARLSPALAPSRAPASHVAFVSGGPEGEPLRSEETFGDAGAIILVVDGAWRITLANRRAREATSEDVVGRALLDVFPRWQGSPVHDALRAAMATGRSVRVRGVPMSGVVDLTIEALPEPDGRKLFLVAHPAAVRPLRTKRADALLVREDLAATNDELQAANEELAAANEELQATNEELASLNEEFLSTNQDLASTNAEMRASAAQGQPSARFLNALLLSRGEAALACDSSRRVTFATPRAALLLRLDPSAVGSPLDAHSLGVPPATLDEWLDAALRAGGPIRREAATSAGAAQVTIEPMAGVDGTALGWLLTWTPWEVEPAPPGDA